MKKTKNLYLNIAFLVVACLILLFLWRAPEETTAKLPKDDTHLPFHAIMSKKEAEKECTSCHDVGKSAPLTEDHPSKFRCLFCHKR